MSCSGELVKEGDIIKSVLDHGLRETVFSLKLKQNDVINCVSVYVNRMKNRVADLEERLFYESLPKNANCLYMKKIMVDELVVVHTDEELTAIEKENSESESSKNSDKNSTSIEKEDKEESETKSSKNSDEESTSTEKEDKEKSGSESSKNSDEESTSTEKEVKEESGTLSSKNGDEELTYAEKEKEEEEEESGLELSMDSVTKSTSTDQEKTVVKSSGGVVSLAQIMMEQAMSTESDLKTLTEKDKAGFSTTGSAVAAGRQMVGRGFGRGSVFSRGSVQGGFGRGHYVRRLQQQKNLVTKEDASGSSDNPFHGGLSMYMENARNMRTRKQKR